MFLSLERLRHLANEDPGNCRLDEVRLMATEIQRLWELAKAYEAWEADLIVNGDWSGECVQMTQAQHDRMMELQAMRNEALLRVTGG